MEPAARKKFSIVGVVLDPVERLMARAFPPLVPSKDNPYLQSKVYGPVEESGVFQDLPVKGILPAAVNGEFVRNGPNPQFQPTYGYHWFDGDGMLHGVRVKDGKANYVARYTKTKRLMLEREYGAPIHAKLGDFDSWYGMFTVFIAQPLRKMAGLIVPSNNSTGNTSVLFFDRRLMVLNEADCPYITRIHEDGELETIGRYSYNNQLNHAFTAHPKVDADTGELFFFGYRLNKAPWITYRRVSADGKISPPIPITIRRPIMMHDFAITKKYAIFMDLPLIFAPGKRMFTDRSVLTFDKSMTSRYGVMPRDADSEAAIKWFELPTCYIFHIMNAWDDGDEVVMYACRLPEMVFTQLARDGGAHGRDCPLYEFRFNMVTGAATERQMTKFSCEFPRVADKMVAKKQRYGYVAKWAGPNDFSLVGIAKIDLFAQPDLTSEDPLKPGTGVLAGYIAHGPGRTGGEPVFVPAGRDGSEDDGYLMTFVYDEAKDKSEFVVWDAKTMSPEPVASVQLPVRVPAGFHGIFVPESDLQNQNAVL